MFEIRDAPNNPKLQYPQFQCYCTECDISTPFHVYPKGELIDPKALHAAIIQCLGGKLDFPADEEIRQAAIGYARNIDNQLLTTKCKHSLFIDPRWSKR